MAVIATQSFDLDEILSLTLRQVLSLLICGQRVDLPLRHGLGHIPPPRWLGTTQL
jgi:hypothetical protein